MIGPQICILIPVVYLFGALLVPLIGWRRGAAGWGMALAAAAVAFVFALCGLAGVMQRGTLSYHLGGWMPPIGIEFVMDPLSAFLEVVISGIGLLAVVYTRSSVEHELPERLMPFSSLALLVLTGLSGMVITGDLFNLYVFLEISALAGYALIAVGERPASYAAFRYLGMGTVGASFYLLGLAFLYMTLGTLNMADLSRMLAVTDLSATIAVGLLLIFMGAALKMALFPMHGWLPDAYTHASSAATALIAPIGTKVAGYILIRVLLYLLGAGEKGSGLPLLSLLAYLGAAAVIYGSILAVCQSELKRMLAYSSIAQVGYIAIGVGLNSALGFTGAVLHVLSHACMKGSLFFVSGSLRLRLGHSRIPRFSNALRRAMPWSSAAFALAALSMIGLPPTAGFFSKWYLALAAIEQSRWLFLGVLLFSSLLNAVYFFRVLERMYLKPPETEPAERPTSGVRSEAPPAMLLPAVALSSGLLVIGLGNTWIVDRLIGPMIPGGM